MATGSKRVTSRHEPGTRKSAAAGSKHKAGNASGRGGARPGSGRKPSWPPVFHHNRRETFEEKRAAYVTLRIRAGEPSLKSRSFAKELKAIVAGLRERNGARSSFRVLRYAVRDDHLHFIIETGSSDELARGMKSLAARVVRAANRVFVRSGPLLLGRYQLEYLRSTAAAQKASVGCGEVCRGPSKPGTHIRPGFEPSRRPR